MGSRIRGSWRVGHCPGLGWGCQLDFQLLPTAREGPPSRRIVWWLVRGRCKPWGRACCSPCSFLFARVVIVVVVAHVRPVRTEESVRKALPAGEGEEMRGEGTLRHRPQPQGAPADAPGSQNAATHSSLGGPFRDAPAKARERTYEAHASAAVGAGSIGIIGSGLRPAVKLQFLLWK